MKNPLWLPLAFIATVISTGQSFAEIEAPDLKWGGLSSLRLGYVAKGEQETVIGKDTRHESVWVQELNAGLYLKSSFKQIPATGNFGLEVAVNSDNTSYPQDFGKSRRFNFYPYLHRADLLFKLRDEENSSMELDVGYFPFKYDSSVRNLGEYLFRSGTYPQYLINNFDFPLARLLGLRFGGSVGQKLNYDVLLTANTEWTAIGDINLSAIVNYKPIPFFEFGLGGSWCSLISVNIDNTTPLATSSEYLAPIPGTNDTAIYNYTFAGQKVMAKAAFDFRQLFPETEWLGKEDLKLYTEAAILGLVNYPISRDGYTQYDTLAQRIPVMVGFNWPTHPLLSYTIVPTLLTIWLNNKGIIDATNFYKPSTFIAAGTGALSGIGLYLLQNKLNIKTGLDILSFEVEYFGNPYPNSTNSIRFDNLPVPLSSFANEKSDVYLNCHQDDWKWSVYARKSFKENFFFVGQIARDHSTWFRLDYTAMDGKEMGRSDDDWYFTFKFGYKF